MTRQADPNGEQATDLDLASKNRISSGEDETLAGSVLRAFADDGPLSETLPSFEPRPGQREMAAAVADILEDGGTLLAEAGTGTGKTLAYLVPAILSGHRVLVSTGTKNLQDQIYYKDRPRSMCPSPPRT